MAVFFRNVGNVGTLLRECTMAYSVTEYRCREREIFDSTALFV
jgi:hypothetical protein